MTTVKYIGAYSVRVPDSEREAAIECHNGDAKYVASELDNVALVELEVRGARKGFDITDFKQPHTECVPYNVAYFAIDSLKRIPTKQYAVPAVSDFRVAFHLHFYDPSEPLETPFGKFQVGPQLEPPPHLSGVEYVYWD